MEIGTYSSGTICLRFALAFAPEGPRCLITGGPRAASLFSVFTVERIFPIRCVMAFPVTSIPSVRLLVAVLVSSLGEEIVESNGNIIREQKHDRFSWDMTNIGSVALEKWSW